MQQFWVEEEIPYINNVFQILSICCSKKMFTRHLYQQLKRNLE